MNTRIILERFKSYGCQTRQQEEQALKEIAQEIVLVGLSRGGFFKKAAFQGGTCLRILYSLNRFSEDLDFVLKSPTRDFHWRPYLNEVATEFGAYGIALEMDDRSAVPKSMLIAWIKTDSIGKMLAARFVEGGKKVHIKLEIDTNPPVGSTFQTRTLDFPSPFAVLTQDLPSLFAGKIHALLCREYVKGRDWYDFLWYSYQKSPYNRKLLRHALFQNGPWKGMSLDPDRNWLRAQMVEKINGVDWKNAKRDIQNFLQPQEIPALELWDKEFFLERLRNYFTVRYQLHVLCDLCGGTHPMPVTVNLDDGPAGNENLNNAFAGRKIPAPIVKMSNNSVVCPRLGKSFLQVDNEKIFLVPLG